MKNNRTIIKYSWVFGDGSEDTGEIVLHSYTNYGNYTVTLTIKDSNGAESSTTEVVRIIPLEEHLENEFQSFDALFIEARGNFEVLDGEVDNFYDFMGYGNVIDGGEDSLDALEANFSAVRGSNSTDKDSKYASIVNDLHSVTKNIPLEINRIGGKTIKNFLITNPDSVFDYLNSGDFSPAYADAIYDFNRDYVSVDVDSTLIEVNFFEGDSNYLYVEKSIEASEGQNKVIVEDLREVSFTNVIGGTQNNATKALYWQMSSGSKNIEYVVQTDNLETINTIVYSNVEIEGGEMYCFSDESCEKFCGDGVCTVASYLGVDEGDEANINYCPQDCEREDSQTKYIILFAVFVVLIIYLLFYKGPGSIKDIVNKFTYGVAKKKLFITERDKVTLGNFINLSLRRGFNQNQIKEALLKKGWNDKQIEEVMKGYLRK